MNKFILLLVICMMAVLLSAEADVLGLDFGWTRARSIGTLEKQDFTLLSSEYDQAILEPGADSRIDHIELFFDQFDDTLTGWSIAFQPADDFDVETYAVSQVIAIHDVFDFLDNGLYTWDLDDYSEIYAGYDPGREFFWVEYTLKYIYQPDEYDYLYRLFSE